jgi:hypothetical protein
VRSSSENCAAISASFALSGGGGDQARIGAGDARHQQVAEVARQLAAEMLQVVAVAL